MNNIISDSCRIFEGKCFVFEGFDKNYLATLKELVSRYGGSTLNFMCKKSTNLIVNNSSNYTLTPSYKKAKQLNIPITSESYIFDALCFNVENLSDYHPSPVHYTSLNTIHPLDREEILSYFETHSQYLYPVLDVAGEQRIESFQTLRVLLTEMVQEININHVFMLRAFELISVLLEMGSIEMDEIIKDSGAIEAVIRVFTNGTKCSVLLNCLSRILVEIIQRPIHLRLKRYLFEELGMIEKLFGNTSSDVIAQLLRLGRVINDGLAGDGRLRKLLENDMIWMDFKKNVFDIEIERQRVVCSNWDYPTKSLFELKRKMSNERIFE